MASTLLISSVSAIVWYGKSFTTTTSSFSPTTSHATLGRCINHDFFDLRPSLI